MRRYFLFVLFGLILIIFFSVSMAQVPPIINYQGKLTDDLGDPVGDGAHLIKFIIYGSETGLDSLWWTGYQSVTTIDGFFSYELGSNAPIPSGFFGPGSAHFLGVTIGTDPELIPRTQMTSSAFAFFANTSDSAIVAGNISCSNCISSTEIAPNSIASTHIQNSTIQFDDLASNGAAEGEIMKMVGGNWTSATDETGSGGGGDITAVAAGSGLTGGGTSGDVSLAVGTGAITNSHLGYNSVTTDKIPDEEITGNDIAHNTLETFHLQDGTLTFNKLGLNGAANGQIMKLIGGNWSASDDESGVMGVTNGQGISITGTPEYPILALQDGGIYSEHIANSQITDAHILNNTIQFEDIGSNDATEGQVMKRTGSSWVAGAVGDITAVYTPEPGGLTGGTSAGDADISIAAGGVTSNFIQNGTIVNEDISAIADIAITKIYGEAVNLIDVQTVEGEKTFEDLRIATTIRRLSISNAAFVPQMSSQGFHRTSNYIRNTTSGFQNLYAQVSLPDGAIVTEVRATFYDDEWSYYGKIELFKVYMYTGAEIRMAEVQSTGTPGLTNINTPFIASSSISNSGYNYYLLVTMAYSATNSNMRLYGAEIVYTITKPLP